MERLVFFSDAVFAIAITLLSIEIESPSKHGALNNSELFSGLIKLWPNYIAYVISFLVVGLFWKGHHAKFRIIIRYDNKLILINLLFLLVIAFTPFPTRILAENRNQVATICYAMTMVVASVLSGLVWWYASGENRLVDPGLNPQERRRRLSSPITMAAIFLLSIALAFINDDLARASWLLLIPAAVYIG